MAVRAKTLSDYEEERNRQARVSITVPTHSPTRGKPRRPPEHSAPRSFALTIRKHTSHRRHGRGQQLLQAARLGAGWHLQVHRDGGTLLARDEQGLSHASSPRVPMPRNAEEEFTRGAREGVLLS